MKDITVTVDDSLFDDATKLYEELGIDLETAIKLFLKQSVFHNELPFKLKLPGKQLKTDSNDRNPIIDDIF